MGVLRSQGPVARNLEGLLLSFLANPGSGAVISTVQQAHVTMLPPKTLQALILSHRRDGYRCLLEVQSQEVRYAT